MFTSAKWFWTQRYGIEVQALCNPKLLFKENVNPWVITEAFCCKQVLITLTSIKVTVIHALLSDL